ncbi:MAG: RDD family protein [Leptolyngbyaceae cyanobacterium bins.302]|nr:RDD family protein [Leptolyngbyaceae cyanobacterium bins.302]
MPVSVAWGIWWIVSAIQFQSIPKGPIIDPKHTVYRRVMAKFIDIFGLIFIFSYFISISEAQITPQIRTGIGLISVLSTSIIEACMIAIFSTTPGKWLFNIYVTTSENLRLTFFRAFQRSLMCWLVGMMGGLPFLSWIGLFGFSNRLRIEGTTLWDRWAKANITTYAVGNWKRGFGYLSIFAIILSNGMLFVHNQNRTREAASVSPPTNNIWINSMTGKSVSLPEGWAIIDSKVVFEKTPSVGSFVYGGKIFVDLFVDNTKTEIPLEKYVSTLKQERERSINVKLKGPRLGKSLNLDIADIYGSYYQDGEKFDLAIAAWNLSPKTYWHLVLTSTKDTDYSEVGPSLMNTLIESTK